MKHRNWLIGYISTKTDSDMSPGPWFWQCVLEPTYGWAEAISRFQKESYAADVEYFSVGEVTENGVRWEGNFKFTTPIRRYEQI